MDVLHLTLRQLQIFVAVARSGSTTAAAETIALSQSATSAALQELERLLALRLFDRVGKRLLLNDNGRALLPRAEALLAGAADVERLARDADAQRGALRIGASLTVADHALPPLLAAFLGERPRTAPHWATEVAVGNTAQICAQVAAFELDIGLIEGPSHEPTLVAQPWLEDELVVVGTPAVAADQGASLTALREAVWLLREAGSGTREVSDQALAPLIGPYRRRITLGSNEALRQAALAGLGLACLSRHVVADALTRGQLRMVVAPLPRISRQWHWVCPAGRLPTPALAALIALLPAVTPAQTGVAEGADRR